MREELKDKLKRYEEKLKQFDAKASRYCVVHSKKSKEGFQMASSEWRAERIGLADIVVLSRFPFKEDLLR